MSTSQEGIAKPYVDDCDGLAEPAQALPQHALEQIGEQREPLAKRAVLPPPAFKTGREPFGSSGSSTVWLL